MVTSGVREREKVVRAPEPESRSHRITRSSKQFRLGFKVDQISKQFRMIFGKGPVIRPSGDLFQPATTVPPPVTAYDITIAISISIGAVCNRFLIRRMLVSSSKTQGFVGMTTEVAKSYTKFVGRVIKALYKAQARSDFLLHLAEEVCEAIRAVQASGYTLKVDFSCYPRQTVRISIRENGCQSITRQDVAHRAFGNAGRDNDRFRSASTIPPLTRMPAFRGIRPQEDAVVVFGMGSANPGIVAASPNVSLDLKGIRLEQTVQYLGISAYRAMIEVMTGSFGFTATPISVSRSATSLRS